MTQIDTGPNQNQGTKLPPPQDPGFLEQLRQRTDRASSLEQLWALANQRKRAARQGVSAPAARTTRLALLGGYTFQPLAEILEHLLICDGVRPQLHLGDFDNYVAEILQPESELYRFDPDVVLLQPSGGRCGYSGALSDPQDQQRQAVSSTVSELLLLCQTVHERTGAEVLLCNYPLPGRLDLGGYRGRTLGSEWSFKRCVNLELGLALPAYVRLVDLEFLGARLGTAASYDARAWYESRQPCSRELLPIFAREIAQQLLRLRQPAKKVLVLDLDNTLWGGVIGDDGCTGIELGDTSPRGEAFKDFQRYACSLAERGVLLCVASKNDDAVAREPFTEHPEMVLGIDDIVSFQANWGPKSESIRSIAAELSLGLDSFVFVDDNRAEIEIVDQFCPEVTTVWLGDDPAEFIDRVDRLRLFEPTSITAEDGARTSQYRQEAERRTLRDSVTDMSAYLASLSMSATVAPFDEFDVPRIAQLINKSNQFNVTTRRRTEAEVRGLLADPEIVAFTVRLRDRFGDHGLISVVIAQLKEAQGGARELWVDSWLMSCRVLERNVEDEVANELLRLAQVHDCARVRGFYFPTAKNGMVRDLFPRLGFETVLASDERSEFVAECASYCPRGSEIEVESKVHECH